MKKKNPFRISYLSIAAVCFVVVGSFFVCISQISYKAETKRFQQQKTESLIREFENQLQLMEDISLRIATNIEFQPYYFKGKIDKELSMLKTFAQYKYVLPIVDNYFLFYGDSYIYRSSDSTLDFNLYMKENLADETECQIFLREVAELQENFSDIWNGSIVMPFSEKLFILMPFRAKSNDSFETVILSFVVKKEDLEERFQFVSGGYEGKIALYQESELLYCNQELTDIRNEKKVYNATSTGGLYSLYFLPESGEGIFSGQFWSQVLLVIANIILIVAIACIWAEKSYKPLREISEKYQNRVPQDATQNENIYEEINSMMETLVKYGTETESKNQQQQKMLKNHFLGLLLQNNYSSGVLSCLDEVDISFPAAYYQVISFSFVKESNVTDDLLNMLSGEIEQLTDKDNEEYVYVCCNYKEKMINVLCNYDSLERKDILNDVVIAIAEGYSYTPIVGIGDTYHMLSGLSASWMESQDEIHRQVYIQSNKRSNFIYDAECLHQIINAMEIGSEKCSLEKLEHFLTQLKKNNHSFLMQQYVFADFMGEVIKLSRKYHVDLCVHSVSSMLASKSMSEFENATVELIHDFCEKYAQTKCLQDDDELFVIYEYVSTHFADYDISLENVAEIFNVSTTIVRQAVLKYTDKTYKEYIIFARIEYAKELLREQNLTIADVCQKIGYANISYFIRLFREVVGITPAKYRQNIIDKI